MAAHAKAKPAKPPKPTGGANQVQGTSGKVGDMLFTGQWRFQVTGFQQVNSYTLKVPASEQDYAKWHSDAEYDDASHTFTPKEGITLIAVDCYVKNGQPKTTEQLDGYSDDPKTALTDDHSNSYPPIAYDMVSRGAWVTKPLLPGSGEKITLLFAVESGTTPKDLVVTLKNWSLHKGKEVRVSLAP
ncbi:hypothetical protein CCAX7_58090 [Capsulimonas corticalis]|uniref:Uncharacterized protein n=2 Tax=Capsulimonas corticalis TaxID=2219043 RepID=A0A402D015_9BACT|nr:hypothetical protein CCAX7_58090 [Capsulimonas corticalis]